MPAVDVAFQHPDRILGAVAAAAADHVCIAMMTIHLVALLINFVWNLIDFVMVAFVWRLSNVLCHHICSIAYCFVRGPDAATNTSSVGRQYSIYSCCHCDGPHDDVAFVLWNSADMHLSMDDALVWH